MAAAEVDLELVSITGESKWHYVSERVRYGFCPECGSNMFRRNDENDFLSVTGGSLNDASRLELGGHMFTGEQGGYYKIPEDEIKYIAWCAPNKR